MAPSNAATLRPVSISAGPTRKQRDSLVGEVETFGLFIHSQHSTLHEGEDEDDNDAAATAEDEDQQPAAPLGARSSRRFSARFSFSLLGPPLSPTSSRSSMLSVAKSWKSEQLALPRKSSSAMQREGSSASMATRSRSSFSLKPTLSSTSLEAVYGPERIGGSFEVDPMRETHRLVREHMDARTRASSRDPLAVESEVHRLAIPKHQAERLRRSISERPHSISLKAQHAAAPRLDP